MILSNFYFILLGELTLDAVLEDLNLAYPCVTSIGFFNEYLASYELGITIFPSPSESGVTKESVPSL